MRPPLASPELSVEVAAALSEVENGVTYDTIKPSLDVVSRAAVERARNQLLAYLPVPTLFFSQLVLASLTPMYWVWWLISVSVGIAASFGIQRALCGQRSLMDDRRINRALRQWRRDVLASPRNAA